ncbi:MAG: tetratricopeptide repeat protein [Calditrichia bacterium]
MAHFLDLKKLENFYESNPTSVIFAVYSSRLLEKGEYERAAEICQAGLQKNPAFPFGHYILGLANYHMKNYSDAKHELEISLALDPAAPKAWKLLGEINEHLNLMTLAKEDYLRAYLNDIFNHEAGERFFGEDLVQHAPAPETEPVEFEEQTGAEVEDLSEEEIENLLDSTGIPEEDTDFQKTLDEVFKETMEDVSKKEDKSEPEPDVSEEPEAQPKEDTLGEETILDRDEFSNAFDSFFKEYEKEEESSDEEAAAESEDGSELMELDEAETEEGTELEEKEFPEEFIEEEPMDFSAVVSDLISERENEVESEDEELLEEEHELEESEELQEAPEELGDESEQEYILRDTISETPESEDVETEMEEKEISARKEPDEPDFLPETEEAEEAAPEEEAEEPETEVPQQPEGSRSSRPPILSPTLGEIYIAQGRFEEAIDVFKQLLEKDPENPRYGRKIEDLQVIIDKQKSSPKDKP